MALAALAIGASAVALVITSAPNIIPTHTSRKKAVSAASVRIPPYWTVRPGDTFSEISLKTGLTLAQIQAFNPDADPLDLVPGQRLNLRLHPPAPRPKPP